MSLRRSILTLALAASLAGCHDEEYVTVVETPPTGFTEPSSATGLTGFDETVGAADVGSDGQPRLVFVREGSRVFFTRRTSTGAWTAPLQLSTDSIQGKSSVFAFVTRSNDFTHVFWLENGEVHYARVNNADPPAIDSNQGQDTVISSSLVGPVQGLTAAVDRVSNTVFAAWIQTVTPGGQIPVAGEVSAAGPTFGDWYPLVTAPWTACISDSLILRVSSAGVLHAAWIGTDAGGNNLAVRHSQRISAGNWGAGDEVSAAGTALIMGDLLLAADGDAYAVWLEDGQNIRSAYRAAGDASTFGAPVDVVTGLSDVTEAAAALEPGTELLHAFWRSQSATVAFYTRNFSRPNLDVAGGGAWSGTDTLLEPVTVSGEARMAAWADSANNVVFVCQAPPSDGEVPHVLLRTRPTGVSSAYSAARDLTHPYGLPCSGLAVGIGDSGTAIIVWAQGGDSPVSDVFGMVYATGGGVGGTANISQSPSRQWDSEAMLALMAGSGAGHVFWGELTAPPAGDIFYVSTK